MLAVINVLLYLSTSSLILWDRLELTAAATISSPSSSSQDDFIKNCSILVYPTSAMWSPYTRRSVTWNMNQLDGSYLNFDHRSLILRLLYLFTLETPLITTYCSSAVTGCIMDPNYEANPNIGTTPCWLKTMAINNTKLAMISFLRSR